MWGELLGAGLGAVAGWLGGKRSNKFNRAMAREQMAAQKEFAQHGVRWRVEDAKAAGIHPLAALGMQGMSYSPVMVSDSVGPALSEGGQNISRAVAAGLNRNERIMADLQLEAARQSLREGDARIAVLESEAARNIMETNFRPGIDPFQVAEELPGFSIDGQGDGYKVVPAEILAHASGDPSTVAGPLRPSWEPHDIGGGVKMLLPDEKTAQKLESMGDNAMVGAYVWMKNRFEQGPEWEERALNSIGIKSPRQFIDMVQQSGLRFGRRVRARVKREILRTPEYYRGISP